MIWKRIHIDRVPEGVVLAARMNDWIAGSKSGSNAHIEREDIEENYNLIKYLDGWPSGLRHRS